MSRPLKAMRVASKVRDHSWTQSVQGAIATWSTTGVTNLWEIACRSLTRSLSLPVLTVSKLDSHSLHSDPLQTRGEEFLFGIDRHDVGAENADATIGTKGDFRHQAGVVLVESFECCNESLAAEVFATEFQRMDQNLGRGHCRSLCGSVCGLKLVTFKQRGVFSSASRRNIGWDGREREKDLVFRFCCHCIADVSADERTQHVDRRRPTSRLCILQHRSRFIARAKKENSVHSLLLQLGCTTRSIE